MRRYIHPSQTDGWIFGQYFPKALFFDILLPVFFIHSSFISHLKIYIYFAYNIYPSFILVIIFRKTINWNFIFAFAADSSNIFFFKLLSFLLIFCRGRTGITAAHTTLFKNIKKILRTPLSSFIEVKNCKTSHKNINACFSLNLFLSLYLQKNFFFRVS